MCIRDSSTLVEYDFPGKVRRLEGAPEEIAARLLDLDAMIREKIDAVIAARVRRLDEFVGQNLELLTKLETAGATGDKLDQALLLAEAANKLSPVWLKGSFRSQIEKLLPESQKAEFARLVDEYWDAIVNEQQAGAASEASAVTSAETNTAPKNSKSSKKSQPQPKVKKKSRFEIVTAERLASFAKEIERAFERQLQSGDIIYQYIAAGIDLTDDQRGRIRELCADFAERTKMSPTEKQNQELFIKIAGTLDTKQQLALANLNVLKPAQVYNILTQHRSDLGQRLLSLEQSYQRQQKNEIIPMPEHIEALYTHSIALMDAELKWLGDFLKKWAVRYPAVVRGKLPDEKTPPPPPPKADTRHFVQETKDPDKHLQRIKRPKVNGETPTAQFPKEDRKIDDSDDGF